MFEKVLIQLIPDIYLSSWTVAGLEYGRTYEKLRRWVIQPKFTQMGDISHLAVPHFCDIIESQCGDMIRTIFILARARELW